MKFHIDGPHKLYLPIGCSWRCYPILSLVWEGDDEPGDPSGITITCFRWQIGIYWPMHGGRSWIWPRWKRRS